MTTNEWECPVCGSRAYQRYGSITIPAVKFLKNKDDKEIRVDTQMKTGQHFMCKGCSVFFGNPRIFNRNKYG